MGTKESHIRTTVIIEWRNKVDTPQTKRVNGRETQLSAKDAHTLRIYPVDSDTLKVQTNAYKERSNLPYAPVKVEYQR